MAVVYKNTVSLRIANDYNQLIDDISYGETYYIYLILKDGSALGGYPVKESYEYTITKDDIEERNGLDYFILPYHFIQSVYITKIILHCEYASRINLIFALSNTSDESYTVYYEYSYDGDFEPSMTEPHKIDGSFIPVIKNNKNFVPQIITSQKQGLSLAFVTTNRKLYIPFTNESNLMIGPKIMHNGIKYASKGDFIAIVTYQNITDFSGYGIKSDFSNIRILKFSTYLNYDVNIYFLPHFYYSQQAGLYLCVYAEKGSKKIHFGILKADGSITDSVFSNNIAFWPNCNTGYFFYDNGDNKYKISFLGYQYVDKAWHFTFGIFSFSIKDEKCVDFSFSENVFWKRINDPVNVAAIDEFQIKRAILSNDEEGFYYDGYTDGHKIFVLIPTSTNTGCDIKIKDAPSYLRVKYFSEEILEEFGKQKYNSLGDLTGLEIDTDRVFYDVNSNSILGFYQKALNSKDVNGNTYNKGDFVAYNLDTGNITLLYECPSGQSTTHFSSIVGIGKIY